MAPRILVITGVQIDETFYLSLPMPEGWHALISRSVTEALQLLMTTPFPIVIYDRDLPSSSWRDVLDQVVAISPDSCFLLVSRVSDEYLWREVVAHGGYDVISKPLQESAVMQSLRRAWNFWRAEHAKA
ncbi:MAG: hypothetical protein ABI824_00435 [Acidobacteriota bacterium]